ncbi:MAG TPA: methylated-DNA--[protein]-cysteine S-methyltransferase [Syntrophomonas sp.]|jgi:methylated-DNA-[protein]-cysteine S-methyltransferase|nr:methylated-DNA--[protein]-cysteine S-methyltransferase [Syntrophomonas sp.]
MNYTCKISSPVGLLTISSDGDNLTGLWIEGQKYFGRTLGKSIEDESLPIFVKVQSWLKQYFDGMQPVIDFPLAPSGSSFRQAVWKILGEIPYGHVITYGEIAKQIKEQSGQTSMSAQAVGGAVGHNPIAIIIPCHRVVGADGSLTGYAGGIKTKIALLELENVPMDRLYVPKKGTAL